MVFESGAVVAVVRVSKGSANEVLHLLDVLQHGGKGCTGDPKSPQANVGNIVHYSVKASFDIIRDDCHSFLRNLESSQTRVLFSEISWAL